MYQVTATRRRPQTFDELLGQDFVSATLKKSIEMGKIANAYLFSGPRGCGKTSTARILAKAINCVDGPTATPCGVCDVCVQITNGSSFDVIEIDGASNTGVDDIRKLKDEILFPPTSAKYKVYIIDEVHMLSTNAFNALLKTIEEPPPYVVFIFATTELHKVPATIKSRCQQFNFRLVDIQTLHDALADAAKEQGIEANDEALFWIAREGTGSVRDSYTLFDQVAAFSDGNITLEKIQDKLGLTSIEAINELVTACVKKNANEALNILHDCLSSGVSVEQFTIDIAKYFRSLLLVKHGITKEVILGQSASRFSAEVLQSWSSTQIERAVAISLQLFKDINYSVNPTFELELAVSRLAWLSDYVPPNELKRAYDNLKSIFEGDSSAWESTNTQKANFDTSAVPASTQTQKLQDTSNIKPTVHFQHKERNPQSTNDTAFAKNQNSSHDEPQNIRDNAFTETSKLPNAEPQITTNKTPSKNSLPQNETSKNIPSFNTLEELKSILVNEFAKTSGLLSAAVNETFAWEKVGSTLNLQTEKAFNKVTIDKNRSLFLKTLQKCFQDTSINFVVSVVKEENPEDLKSDVPPQMVQNLMRVFQARLVEERELPKIISPEN